MRDIATNSILPEPLFSRIRTEQQTVSSRYSSMRAMDWPPHITIAQRVSIPDDTFDSVCVQMRDACSRIQPISLSLGKRWLVKTEDTPFENPYVIAYSVDVTSALNHLHHEIQETVLGKFSPTGYLIRGYHPHVTLAYRDLTQSNYEQAKMDFNTSPEPTPVSFRLSNVDFMEKQSDGHWKSVESFSLGK